MRQQVVFVDETADIGGAEVNLLTITPHLHEAGWHPIVVVPGAGRLTEKLHGLGVSTCYVPRPPLLSSSWYIRHRYKIPNPLALPLNAVQGMIWVAQLYALFRRVRPAVVQSVSMWSHAFAGLAGRLAGCPVVWHFQDIVSPRSGFGAYRALVRLCARYIPTRILCISDIVADQFRDDERAGGKVHVLWNTVDTQRHAYGPARDRELLTIGTVARLTPWKGHEVALHAARMLKQRGMSFRWLIAGDEGLGDTGYRAHLLNLINDWGLKSEVQLVGWVADMPAFYRSLDVLVHPAIEPEPFGLVLAEAMASGLSVIATTGGGAEHMIEPAGGLLVPPSRADAIADALLRIGTIPRELVRRGERARRFAEQRFGTQQYVEQLVRMYQSLAEGV